MVATAASANWLWRRPTRRKVSTRTWPWPERHAELIGLHGGRRGAISEQLELFADAILGLSAGAVEILIEGTRVVGDAGALEEGDDEARIRASCVCSALPTTRRVRFQLSIVRYGKSRTRAPAGRGGT